MKMIMNNFIVLVTLAACMCVPCAARTIIVAADSSGEFVHIGEAADSAQCGDTVLVRNGYYPGLPSIGEEISVDSGVVVIAEHAGAVAVDVAPSGIALRGSAKLMGCNLAANPISHSVCLVSIEGGPATVYNCGFHYGGAGSIGSQVYVESKGQPPYITACNFQLGGGLFILENLDSTNFWMPENYYNTVDTALIHLLISDGSREPGFGFVYVSPVLETFQWLGIEQHPAIATEFNITVFPNPFNSTTEIRYALPGAGRVSMKVYDVTGREVAVLVDQMMNAGEQRVTWPAEGVASGVYFVRLQAGGFLRTEKVLLLR